MTSTTLTHLPKVSELEVAESVFGELVPKWRAQLEAAGVSSEQAYWRLADAITARMAAQVGVEFAGLEALPIVEAAAAAAAAPFGEAHALGWFHQHFGEVERARSFRAHHHEEAKHQSSVVSTQLYTPRWIADFLARACLAQWSHDRSLPTLLDPALGAGQMLLAGLGALRERYPGADVLELVCCLHGTDLDGRAVEMARRGLKLEAARMLGRRVAEIEAAIDARLRVDDGLFGTQERCDIVLTNPPYMGSRSMSEELKARVRTRFEPFHADLYAAFIWRCHELARHSVGILAQQTIWYLSRFAAARARLLDAGAIASFLHLGPHAFATLSGEKANVVAFVQRSSQTEPRARATTFIDLRDGRTARGKWESYRSLQEDSERVRRIQQTAFAGIPGHPMAHWLPTNLRTWFGSATSRGRVLGDIADVPGSQNKTGANARYVKPFADVDPEQILTAKDLWQGAPQETARWVFYSKGGRYAPWWGNWQHVVDWSEEARHFYAANPTSNLLDEAYWFRPGICYTDFGGQQFNARLMPAGCVFDMAGPAIFLKEDEDGESMRLAMLALLNSTPARALLNAMNPSIHYQVRDVRRLPVPEFGQDLQAELARRAEALVEDVRRLAGLVPQDPLFGRQAPEVPVSELVQRVVHGEHELDALVCELYKCPGLLPEIEARPEHAVVRCLRAREGRLTQV